MLSPVLAFRPARVVERLASRSGACPLSSRDLLRVAAALRLTLPLVRAPTVGIARGALVAAKQARSVLGLALPAGTAPEPWFAAVTAAADDVAAGLPIFLAGEVEVVGRREAEVERAVRAAWALADAGLTHLAVDLSAVDAPARAEVLARVAAPAAERGLGLDLVVRRDEVPAARALYEAAARRGARPDVASLRCEAPGGVEAARGQVRELLALCAGLSGGAVLRRGPVTPDLLGSLRGAPISGCEDGGAAAAAALAPVAATPPGDGRGRSPAARAEDALSEWARQRLEARAYGEVLDFLERLGAAGSAARVAAELSRDLVEREP